MGRSLAPNSVPYAKSRTALQQYRSLLSLLNSANEIANCASSLEDALQRVLDQIALHIGWPVCHVYLPAPSQLPELAPSSIWHLATPEQFARFRHVTEVTSFRPGLGLVGQVQATGQPLWAPDVTADQRFIRRHEGGDLGVRAGILFPILVDRNVVGVLECFSPHIIHPDPSLLEVLANVGVLLGRVFERTRPWADGSRPLDLAQVIQLQRVRSSAAGALAASIAHEVNNPLYAARSAFELLKSEVSPSEERLSLIVSGELARIADVMGRLGTFAPLPDLRCESADLRQLIDGALAESLVRMRRPAIQVQFTVTSLCSHTQIVCDQALIQQALCHVFTNAADAMPDGGVLSVHALVAHDRIEIAISDSGPGLPAAVAPHIFEPFFTTKPGRSGLGLAICAQIVAQHGGQIAVETVEGQGTTLRLTVPCITPTHA
jgi:signal transduction histidine kinase